MRMTTSNGSCNTPLRVGFTVILLASAQAAVAQVYITGWATDNDIYTNLNQQFPNTGPGVPGSGVGTPNATFLFDPSTYSSTNSVGGSDLAGNGIDFLLASDSAGQDFAQVGSSPSFPSLAVTTAVSGVTDVYLLTAAYDGTTYNATFTGTGGATDTFTGVNAPNLCGSELNTTSGGALDQSVLEVRDVGACGSGNSTNGFSANYYLYEQTFALNSSFTGQNLTGISITSGNTLLVLGITANGTAESSTPEPSTFGLFGIAAGGLGLLRRHR
jgi:hypothetical protein